MSKLFFDHLLELDELETCLRGVVETEDERHELWQIIDEIVHHEVLGCVFDHLPYEHHGEFLEIFHDAPYDEGLVIFVNEKAGVDLEDLLSKKISELQESLLKDFV